MTGRPGQDEGAHLPVLPRKDRIMTGQSELDGLRRRLVAVLRERLVELEDDEARQANWEKTNWDLTEGVRCVRCHKPAFRFRDGICFPCVGKEQERAYQLADRLSKVQRRYPNLTRGLRRQVARRKGPT